MSKITKMWGDELVKGTKVRCQQMRHIDKQGLMRYKYIQIVNKHGRAIDASDCQ